MNTKRIDRAYVSREASPVTIEIARTKGSYMYDRQGRKYVDFFMGWCVGNIGWGNAFVRNAIKKFQGPDYFSPMYLNTLWAELAQLLVNIAPPGLQKVYFTTGGTESVEYALQAAMSATKRHKFISIEGSYHGHSIGAMSVGSSDFRKKYKNLLFHCNKIKPPLDVVAAKKVVALLKKRDIAAYISEPVICNLAVEIPTQEYYKIVRKACKKYGTIFIMDEVATGFGRTGKLFASEQYKLKPDILCLAKGLTGGYGALGAVVMTNQVSRAMQWGFSFYSTFGGHPLNVTAAIANVQYIIKHKHKLLSNANEMGIFIVNQLKKIRFKYPVTISAQGLAIGITFPNEWYASEIKKSCLQNGLLVSDAVSGSIVIFPALNVTKKIIQEGLDILIKVITKL